MPPPPPSSYRAVTLNKADKYHDIVIQHIKLAKLDKDQVLVKLSAAGYNRREVQLSYLSANASPHLLSAMDPLR